jgi:hypothetical protein
MLLSGYQIPNSCSLRINFMYDNVTLHIDTRHPEARSRAEPQNAYCIKSDGLQRRCRHTTNAKVQAPET